MPLETDTGLRRRTSRGYGWVPDLPDPRDQVFAAPQQRYPYPPYVNLKRGFSPIVYDQLDLGSCTGNAIAAVIEFLQRKQGKPSSTPSRLFIYYNERVMLDTVNEDSGAMLRDGIKSVAKIGAPPEIPFWPYEIERFATKPSKVAYKEALKYQVLRYQRVPRTLPYLKSCLASGFPFVFGFSVFESFESDAVVVSGDIPLPQPDEAHLGGHAVVATGYDETAQVFLGRNSYGDKWGKNGYFTIPYDYLLNENLSDDFWTIKLVE